MMQKILLQDRQLDECYIRNGICYALTRDCILNHKNIYGEKLGYCITEKEIVNIDTIDDLIDDKDIFLKK